MIDKLIEGAVRIGCAVLLIIIVSVVIVQWLLGVSDDSSC